MTIFSATDLACRFGVDTLYEGVSFALETNDRLGVVGANGCGKSTLLSMIIGEKEPDEGSIYVARDKRVGILRQEEAFEISELSGGSALEQMYTAFPELLEIEKRSDELSSWLDRHPEQAGSAKHDSITKEYSALQDEYARLDGHFFRSRCRSVLEKMGFSDSDMSLPLEALSGGQKNRLALSRQLCREPDILILDEPTNHLDADTLIWLENYLSGYQKCIITVSHDRYFLDKVTNKTLIIEHKKATLYKGNYSQSRAQHAKDREIYERHYYNQQKEIARQEAYIEQQRRWNRERNIIAAESRQKLLDKMEKLEAPEADEKTVRMKFSRGLPSGNEVLSVRDMGFAYPGSPSLFHNLSFLIKRGERVFITGHNGCGKSTLIRLLLGKLKPTSGVFDFGHNVEIGYYDQENQNLNEKGTVLSEIWDKYPTMAQKDVRGALGAFLFRGDDVFKEVSVLSGGERARLTLVKLMLSEMNTLLLDEPTNHLDIGSREALEEAIDSFDGTLICVSHDRAFINRLATRILAFTPDGGMINLPLSHPGSGWDEWQQSISATGSGAWTEAVASQTSNKEQYLQKKKDEAEARKAAARLERLLKEQHALEKETDDLNAELYGPAANDYKRAAEISDRIAEIEDRLMEIYEETEK